jgi:hypothetical protein
VACVLGRRQRLLALREGVDPPARGRLREPRLVHLPIHASWLNQVELYLSIVQRKALTPNDLGSLEELAERRLAFGQRYRQIACPFEWTFTRRDLERVLERVDAAEAARAEAARTSACLTLAA